MIIGKINLDHHVKAMNIYGFTFLRITNENIRCFILLLLSFIYKDNPGR